MPGLNRSRTAVVRGQGLGVSGAGKIRNWILATIDHPIACETRAEQSKNPKLALTLAPDP